MTLLSDIRVDVSRETKRSLENFVILLEKWNSHINLVSKATFNDVWARHVADSAQLIAHIPKETHHYVDLGSGGGFPGLIIAIIAQEKIPSMTTTLVESDQRKATFLRTALREAGILAKVISQRAEAVDPLRADILSARAMSDLSKLLPLAMRHLKPGGIALFPKGSDWQTELKEAQNYWAFSSELMKSKTDPNAMILKIGDIAHV